MKIGILSTVAWQTPPEHYGPWEQMASNLCEGLVERGHEVTLFATGNSRTAATLRATAPAGYEEDRTQDAKVIECVHISNFMKSAQQFDILHNHFDFLPLTYKTLVKTPMVTTIHGFSDERIVDVYVRYNAENHYVAISNANRHPRLDYAATIYNGINTAGFDFKEHSEGYLLFFGRLHPDKGIEDAIKIARVAGRKLVIAVIKQDEGYFERVVKPLLGDGISYIGPVGGTHRSAVLGGAGALLHPIYFDEPFGLSVAEAMMCGTPVIAYNRGSMAELIDDGKSGFLVSGIGEAISALKKVDGLNRRDISLYAKAKFSAGAMVEAYENLYRRILLFS